MADRIGRIIGLIFTTRRLMHEQKTGKTGSFLQFVTLAYAKEHTPSMTEIALFLGVSSPSATSLVRNLAASGLVVRREVAGDRRMVRIAITRKGETFLASHRVLMEEGMRARLSKLTGKEQLQLESILSKIVAGNIRNDVTE